MNLIICLLILTIIILFIHDKLKYKQGQREHEEIDILKRWTKNAYDVIAALENMLKALRKQEGKLKAEVVDVRQDLANSFKKTMTLEDTVADLNLQIKKYKNTEISISPEVLKVFNKIVIGHVFEKLLNGTYHIDWQLWHGTGWVTSNHKSIVTKDELYNMLLYGSTPIYMDPIIDPDFHFPTK